MQENLTIVHVDCGKTWGGGQAQVFMLLEGLRKIGHRNILVCREDCPLAKRASEAGVASVAKARFGTLTMPRVVRILDKVTRDEGAHVLHLHDSRAHSIGALFAAQTPERPPIVVSRRVAFDGRPTILSKWKYRHGADHYIAISNASARTVLAHGVTEDCITVVPSCYASEPDMRLKGTNLLKAQLHLPDQMRVIAAIGGLSRIKGHEILLQAYAKIAETHNDSVLVLAGDGPEGEKLRAQIEQLSLSKRVFLLGFVKDLTPVYSDTDLFVLPSFFEGLNTSLLQAMAWGIPCVATNVGGVPEAITDGVEGVLVPPGDADALARAIAGVWSNISTTTEMAQAARQKAVAHFSKQQMVRGTESVYRDVLSKAY